MRLALAQFNARVGDPAGNAGRVVALARQAHEQGAEMVIFPELAISGYPPEDLLLRDDFLASCRSAVREVAQSTSELDCALIVGAPHEERLDVFNAAHLLYRGQVVGVHRKVHLPTYAVFDERRYFAAGTEASVFDIGDVRVGVTVCEDIWVPGAPFTDEALCGAQLIVNISASPYQRNKARDRERMLTQRCVDHRVALAYVNLIGGQDELVFDGGSVAISHRGEVLARASQFREELLICDISTSEVGRSRRHDPRMRGAATVPPTELGQLPAAQTVLEPLAQEPVCAELGPLEEVYEALRLGLSDYVGKSGFAKTCLGLSGGVDSALVALIAVDALGADNVHALVMPSPYSSAETQSDAEEMADALGIARDRIEIGPIMQTFGTAMREPLMGDVAGIAEENLQARIRGTMLMTFSNQQGHLLLSTGNKSEIAVGYSTLYGDSCGGFAPIKDVPKTLVFALTDWRISQDPHLERAVRSILDRPPSAELRPDQKDSDSLPPYDVLDPILEGLIERDEGLAELTARGFDPATVMRVISMVNRAEYKRRQMAPGVKITARIFGRDRRVPIANAYRHDIADARS